MGKYFRKWWKWSSTGSLTVRVRFVYLFVCSSGGGLMARMYAGTDVVPNSNDGEPFNSTCSEDEVRVKQEEEISW